MLFDTLALRANFIELIRNDNQNKRFVSFLSALTAIFMIWPLDHLVSVFCIILFVHWFFTVRFELALSLLLQRWLILLPILVWLLYFWLNLRPDISARIWAYELERRLPLLIFGLVIGSSNISRLQITTIFWGYVLSCLVLFITMFCLAAQNSLNYGLDIPFYERVGGQNLAQTLKLHRVYSGMHCLWAAILCVWLASGCKKGLRYSSLKICILVFIFGLMILALILLSGRGPFLAACLIAVMGIFIHFVWTSKKITYLVFSFVLLFGVLAAAWFLPVSRRFIKDTVSVSASEFALPAAGQSSPVASRLLIWQASMDQIGRHWALGVGSGVAIDSIAAAGKRLGIEGLTHNRFNAHNQFLDSWLQMGLVGLAGVLAIIFVPLLMAFKAKNFLIVYFLSMFAVCLVSESMFSNQKGIVFFAFFYALLHNFFYNKPSILRL